mmetsp:Transcript_121229/g.387336  ORF Transcript_121229/g.387336 Transcript_121229/m.387336 type:complete len:214 (+) Transcript_121229:1070-1711(+)
MSTSQTVAASYHLGGCRCLWTCTERAQLLIGVGVWQQTLRRPCGCEGISAEPNMTGSQPRRPKCRAEDGLIGVRGLPCLHLGEHVPKQSVLGMLPGRGAAQAIEEVRVPRARILVLRPLRRQRRGEHVPDGDHLDAVGRLAVDRGGHAQVPAEVLELRPPQHRRRHADRRGRAGAPTPARRAGRRGASANFRGRCLGFGNLIRILAGAPYSRA